MTDASRNTSRSQESVVDLATISLKESLAAIFRWWDSAIHHVAGDPEQVHQLRVSTRRAKAALQLFRDFLPRRKTERLLRQLNALRKSAGPARDADVLIERLTRLAVEQSSSPLADHLRVQRSEAQQVLRSHYEKCERGELLEQEATDLLGALRPRGRRTKETVVAVEDWVSSQLRSAIREFFAEAKVDSECHEKLHQFRIRAKQFRYLLELLQPSLPADRYEKAFRGMKKLTQRLGEINDHAAAVAAITGWLESDGDDQIDDKFASELRRWRKDERRALRRAVADFDDWWDARRRSRLRRQLKKVATTDNTEHTDQGE